MHEIICDELSLQPFNMYSLHGRDGACPVLIAKVVLRVPHGTPLKALEQSGHLPYFVNVIEQVYPPCAQEPPYASTTPWSQGTFLGTTFFLHRNGFSWLWWMLGNNSGKMNFDVCYMMIHACGTQVQAHGTEFDAFARHIYFSSTSSSFCTMDIPMCSFCTPCCAPIQKQTKITNFFGVNDCLPTSSSSTQEESQNPGPG